MAQMSALHEDITDPIVYRLYFSLMMNDICRSKGLPSTPYVKQRLHEIHKKALKYDSIAGKSPQLVSQFVFEVGCLWSCFGVFVRTNRKQPWGIENMNLSDIVEVDGEKKRVWDLL